MSAKRLAAIFGNGRSGTTWLGAILSSHPEVAYRFEPFKRARGLGPEQEATARMLDSDRVHDLDSDRLYDALLPAYPDWDKPPFFRKHYRSRLAVGRSLLWPPSRRSAALRWMFRALYTPTDQPYVVFKEVAFEDAYRAFVQRTQAPVVYLVRHPCAIVNSLMRGQEKGLMGAGRQKVAEAFLRDRAPELLERYGDRLESMGAHQKEALLWRANVERCMEVSDTRDSAIVVFYENLCREPLAQSKRVFAAFGLDLDPQVENFVSASTASDARRRGRLSETGINQYFSVFRDPMAAMNSWKTGLTQAQQSDVLELVRDSEVFKQGSRMASWEG